MLRPLGFYLSLGISHNFPWKMRPKMVVSQEERGDDLLTPPWLVLPRLRLSKIKNYSRNKPYIRRNTGSYLTYICIKKTTYLNNFLFYFISVFLCGREKTRLLLHLQKNIHLLVSLYFLLIDSLSSTNSIPTTHLSCFQELEALVHAVVEPYGSCFCP